MESSMKNENDSDKDHESIDIQDIDQLSEASSISFHSLQEKIESLDVGETDFRMPSDFSKATEKPEEYFESEEHINEDDCFDRYFIDEDYLKDLELTLSEENKKVHFQSG